MNGRSARLLGVIFDLDGVLVDSEPLHAVAFSEVLKEEGFDISPEEMLEYAGVSDLDISAELYRRRLVKSTPEVLTARKIRRYTRMIDDRLEMHEGALEVLERFAGRFVLGLASASWRAQVEPVVGKFHLSRFFAAIVTGDDVRANKPAPDVYLAAAAKMGFPPHRCLGVEDSFTGVTAVKAAGMACIQIVADPSIPRNEDADEILASLSDLTPERSIEVFERAAGKASRACRYGG